MILPLSLPPPRTSSNARSSDNMEEENLTCSLRLAFAPPRRPPRSCPGSLLPTPVALGPKLERDRTPGNYFCCCCWASRQEQKLAECIRRGLVRNEAYAPITPPLLSRTLDRDVRSRWKDKLAPVANHRFPPRRQVALTIGSLPCPSYAQPVSPREPNEHHTRSSRNPVKKCSVLLRTHVVSIRELTSPKPAGLETR